MHYNFDEIYERRKTNSVKWSSEDSDVLPLWVADMDFKVPPAVTDALVKKAEEGIFGYNILPQEYYDAICNWWKRRHNWSIKKDWIVFSPGIVTALNIILEGITKPGDKVLLQTPVYHPFYKVIKNNKCDLIENPLKVINGKYCMDFEDLEQKIAANNVKVMILCSPHNPVGRVWTEDELRKIGDICLKHNVIVISDEIHCDLVYSPNVHIPFASISEEFLNNSITCTAPSKTFNLAGLQISNIIVPNEKLRTKVEAAFARNTIGEPTSFAITAAIAAYNQGEQWLDELIKYLYGNYEFLKEFLEEKLPELKVAHLEGTYLTWVDCSALPYKGDQLKDFFLEKAKLWFNEGIMFGAAGKEFIRINIACPRSTLAEALSRMEKAIKAFV
ncbi:MalY/PatB family protein [Clostridium oryzae]|uniref:cysteine-S-conjugate beta-lyase n=1 Tax=Clostridium oryzae TaxID=1450648 RepID=A0A1V4IYD6_9CLOT|nr:MalY/PatB family protein [Clostridium oryzae]OPJ65082.1 cystathionine beta-lyase PatB [Clostridium oryzae]